ncbi:cytochrome b N-terminal domain-containing protein [Streptomyces sp. JJ36]|uniref:cytochrome bc1 complex cytochrome b subunit n=1 Tax=Streptomyces sp. JJ36 TaxID=2736645 RepID=UPI001F0100F1|nr:cytochrome b N-terminal domain-containing protein [Streptomyces sp. JJ36]MCF6524533.1 cytochrome b N-terminal domain-containing protein [Streptomyces sp. JJ36]
MPLVEAGRQFLRKAFPDHWSFLLGEIALYTFVVLVLTGVFLTFFFSPSLEEHPYAGPYVPLQGTLVSEAYASTVDLSFDVRGGLLMRQIHHWAALLFLSAIGLHLLRIFFTGAFRRPREGNWMIGVTMFALAMFEGFCGYSLADDLLSGTGLRTFEGILLSIPVIGTYLTMFTFGGQYPGHDIVERFYVLHVLLVPGLLIVLIAAHLGLVIYLKHTQWAEKDRTNRNVIGAPFHPRYTAKSVGLFFGVFGILAVLGATMQINPIWNYGPYRPNKASIDVQPDWYVGFIEGALRLMPQAETNLWGHTVPWDVFIPGVLIPVLLFAVLYAYPLFERWVDGGGREYHLCDRPRNQPVRTGLGVAGVVFYAVLLLAGAQDVVAYVFTLHMEALTWGFRSGLILFPVVAFWLTRRVCLGLQAQDRARLRRGDETDVVRRTAGGGYALQHNPLPEEQERLVLARDLPRPLTLGGHMPVKRREKVRRALHRWYFRDRVPLPVTPEERGTVREILTDPAEHSPEHPPVREPGARTPAAEDR